MNNPEINNCESPKDIRYILETDKEWGNSDAIFLFANIFKVNVCVHVWGTDGNGQNRVTFAHCIENPGCEFVHLNLKEKHYTPLIPKRDERSRIKLKCIEKNNNYKNSENTSYRVDVPISEQTKFGKGDEIYKRSKINSKEAKVRPPREPPWCDKREHYLKSGNEIPKLNQIKIANEHPFYKNNNLVHFLTSDCYDDTEITRALIERKMINMKNLEAQKPGIGEIIVSEIGKNKLFVLVLGHHIDNKI